MRQAGGQGRLYIGGPTGLGCAGRRRRHARANKGDYLGG